MRLAGLAAMLVLGTSALNAYPTAAVHQPRGTDPRDLHHCQLTAVHPADNDIHPVDNRRVKAQPAELPAPVARRILDHVSDQAKKQFTLSEWFEAQQRCADIFSPVFKLNGPDGLQLYVAPRYFPLGNQVDYFVMHDPRTGAVTKAPPLIYTKWWGPDDPLIKRPIVRMQPARHGRPALLIVEERTHNGTVYNAAVDRYFEIGKDTSLTQILAIEPRAYLLSDGLTERKATFLTPDRVRIEVSTRRPRKYRALEGGSVLLERSRRDQPFHVARRAPRGESNGLVTYCPSAKSDDEFLRVGCDFYY
jgi:hypothetical protein